MKKIRVKVVPILSSAVNDTFIPEVQIPLSLEEVESYVFFQKQHFQKKTFGICVLQIFLKLKILITYNRGRDEF
ncbi:hypothetical protein GCM10023260_08480 [Bartonella acomydis]|uniref:Uncharacterized protein n=1 Tax=Bartonella acomydis TaxID=686234 RepID=A0ABP9MKW7_9HYPH